VTTRTSTCCGVVAHPSVDGDPQDPESGFGYVCGSCRERCEVDTPPPFWRWGAQLYRRVAGCWIPCDSVAPGVPQKANTGFRARLARVMARVADRMDWLDDSRAAAAFEAARRCVWSE